MRHLKLTLALAMLAVASVSVSVAGNSSAAADEANKSDLGINLSDAGANTEGKDDCDCAAGLYDSNTGVNGSYRVYGRDIPTVIITRAEAETTRNDLKSVAAKDGVFPHMKAERLTACVFGAPNASGCGN